MEGAPGSMAAEREGLCPARLRDASWRRHELEGWGGVGQEQTSRRDQREEQEGRQHRAWEGTEPRGRFPGSGGGGGVVASRSRLPPVSAWRLFVPGVRGSHLGTYVRMCPQTCKREAGLQLTEGKGSKERLEMR